MYLFGKHNHQALSESRPDSCRTVLAAPAWFPMTS